METEVDYCRCYFLYISQWYHSFEAWQRKEVVES